MVAFGAAYAVASLSCTLAVLLAVIGAALATSSVVLLFGVFLAYGADASTILLLLSVSTALAGGALERGMRRLARVVTRVSGAILVLSGLYLIAYWVPVLLGGRPDGALAGSITGVSGRLQALVADNVGPLTAVTAIAVGAPPRPEPTMAMTGRAARPVSIHPNRPMSLPTYPLTGDRHGHDRQGSGHMFRVTDAGLPPLPGPAGARRPRPPRPARQRRRSTATTARLRRRPGRPRSR